MEKYKLGAPLRVGPPRRMQVLTAMRFTSLRSGLSASIPNAFQYKNYEEQMNPFQYLFYKIYKTSRRIDKFIHTWRGPRYHAAAITSLLLCSPFIIVIYKTGIWRNSGSMALQFISGFILLLMAGVISFYFDSTKTSNLINQKFSKESKTQSLFGALLINILIVVYIGFLIKNFFDGN